MRVWDGEKVREAKGRENRVVRKQGRVAKNEKGTHPWLRQNRLPISLRKYMPLNSTLSKT